MLEKDAGVKLGNSLQTVEQIEIGGELEDGWISAILSGQECPDSSRLP
jgi:hypothetical protein